MNRIYLVKDDGRRRNKERTRNQESGTHIPTDQGKATLDSEYANAHTPAVQLHTQLHDLMISPIGLSILRDIKSNMCCTKISGLDYFLAVLDYVSRAHEIEIRPSSVRPSVCGIDYL